MVGRYLGVAEQAERGELDDFKVDAVPKWGRRWIRIKERGWRGRRVGRKEKADDLPSSRQNVLHPFGAHL